MNAKKSLLSIVWACTDNVDTFCERNTCCSDLLCSGWTLLQTEIKSLEHKTGIDLTVSSTLKKPSKNYTCFILRHFWRAIYGFWRVKKKKKNLRFLTCHFDVFLTWLAVSGLRLKSFASQHCRFLRHKALWFWIADIAKCCFIFLTEDGLRIIRNVSK